MATHLDEDENDVLLSSYMSTGHVLYMCNFIQSSQYCKAAIFTTPAVQMGNWGFGK